VISLSRNHTLNNATWIVFDTLKQNGGRGSFPGKGCGGLATHSTIGRLRLARSPQNAALVCCRTVQNTKNFAYR